MDIVASSNTEIYSYNSGQNDDISTTTANATQESSEPKSSEKKIKVLLVDDDVMMNEMVKMIIGDKAILTYASNGDIALDLASKEHFDIIYLDINLKHRINGIEVQHQLRTMPNYVYTPIVAFTAYAIIGDEERFLQHGFSYYLPKPFTIEEFIRCIKLEYPKAGF